MLLTELMQTLLAGLGITNKEDQQTALELMWEQMEKDRNLNPPKTEGECFFCHKPTTDWDLCYGCKQYVCEDCENPAATYYGRPHTVHEHKAESN